MSYFLPKISTAVVDIAVSTVQMDLSLSAPAKIGDYDSMIQLLQRDRK